jgi:hypothetical protein
VSSVITAAPVQPARTKQPNRTAQGATPELALLIECARARLEPENTERIRGILQLGVDWAELGRLAMLQKMLPLVYWHLKDFPEAAAHAQPMTDLRAAFLWTAGRNLHLTGRLLSVLHLFESHGIPVVPYKGPILSAQLYGNTSLRQITDLDVLIRQRDFSRARDLLLKHGFEPKYKLSEDERAFQQANRYDEKFQDRDGTFLELHWRFANRDIDFALTLDDMLPRLMTYKVSGNTVRVVSPEDLLLILCVHGAKHRWDRLEWLAGISEVMRGLDAAGWETVRRRAKALNARRVLLLGCWLAHNLLGTQLPPAIRGVIHQEPWVQRLGTEVRDRLYAGGADHGFVGLLSRNLFQFPLQEGPLRRMRYMLYRVVTPHKAYNWRAVHVAGHAVPVHSLTYPFRLAWKMTTLPVRALLRR